MSDTQMIDMHKAAFVPSFDDCEVQLLPVTFTQIAKGLLTAKQQYYYTLGGYYKGHTTASAVVDSYLLYMQSIYEKHR